MLARYTALVVTLAGWICGPASLAWGQEGQRLFGRFLEHRFSGTGRYTDRATTPSATFNWSAPSLDEPSVTGGKFSVQVQQPSPATRFVRKYFDDVREQAFVPDGGLPISVTFSGVLNLKSSTTGSASFTVRVTGSIGLRSNLPEPGCSKEEVHRNVSGNTVGMPISVTVTCTASRMAAVSASPFPEAYLLSNIVISAQLEQGPFTSVGGWGGQIQSVYQVGLPYIELDKTSRMDLYDAFPEPVKLTNKGIGALNWQTTAITADGVSWLKVTPSSGTLATDESVTLNVFADLSSLQPPSLRWGRVVISAPDATNSPREVFFTLNYLAKDPDKLSLGDAIPQNRSRLALGTRPEIMVDVPYRLTSRPDARLVLRVFDQDGVQQASSPATPVQKGAGRLTLKIAPFDLAPTTTSLIVRAAFLDSADQKVFLQSDDAIFYDAAPPLDKINFVPGSFIPDPGKLLTIKAQQPFQAKVRYTVGSRAEATLALRLVDDSGKENLVRSSEFSTAKRSEGTDFEKTLSIASFELPADAKPLFLKAVLITTVEPITVLAETSPLVKYEFEKPPELNISHIEVVQVVQTKDNFVSLIQGKATVVRVFVTQKEQLDNRITRIRGTLGARTLDGKALAWIPTQGPPANRVDPDTGAAIHNCGQNLLCFVIDSKKY